MRGLRQLSVPSPLAAGPPWRQMGCAGEQHTRRPVSWRGRRGVLSAEESPWGVLLTLGRAVPGRGRSRAQRRGFVLPRWGVSSPGWEAHTQRCPGQAPGGRLPAGRAGRDPGLGGRGLPPAGGVHPRADRLAGDRLRRQSALHQPHLAEALRHPAHPRRPVLLPPGEPRRCVSLLRTLDVSEPRVLHSSLLWRGVGSSGHPTCHSNLG